LAETHQRINKSFMDYLPPDFPKHLVQDPVDLSKISWFCRRYTSDYYAEYKFGHFLLAAYASVPALLTPDLLYRVWMNFNHYQWGSQSQNIHRVAVSDVLLSPLCREVGYELYEMPDSIRFALRFWLDTAGQDADWQSRQIVNALSIAAFTEEYHLTDNKGTRRWGKSYENRQRIEAISVRNPAEAQSMLLNNLNTAQKSDKKIEVFRVLDLMTRQRNLHTTLQTKDSANAPGFTTDEFQHNALLADVWKAVLQEDTDMLEQLIADYPVLRDYLFKEKPADGQSFEVKVPDALVQKVEKMAPPTLYAFIVGAWDYQGDIPKLKGPENDCADMLAFLEQIAPQLPGGYQLKITDLSGEKATIAGVRAAIENMVYPPTAAPDTEYSNIGQSSYSNTGDSYSNTGDSYSTTGEHQATQGNIPPDPVLPPALQDGDSLFFYFAGLDIGSAEGRVFLLHDAVLTENSGTGLPQKFIEDTWFPLVEKHKIHVFTLYDSCYKVNETQQKGLLQGQLRTRFTAMKGTWVVLNAADLQENSFEMVLEGKNRGIFTHNFIQTAGKSLLADYNSLMTTIQPLIMERKQQQHPFLEAFPQQAEYLRLFTGKTGEHIYPVEYDPELQQWTLRAGSKEGITPSVGLIPTLIRLQNGQECKIAEVWESYSAVDMGTESDFSKKYTAIVLQKAPERVQIADMGAATALRSAIDSLKSSTAHFAYFQWSNQPETAALWMAETDRAYYLSQQMPGQDNGLNACFPPESDPQVFNLGLAFYSRFVYLKKLVVLPRNDLKKYVQIDLKKVRGASFNLSAEKREQLGGTAVKELNFNLLVDADPAFRCTLILDDYNFRKQNLYIYPFYFAANTGTITALPEKIWERKVQSRGMVAAGDDIELAYDLPDSTQQPATYQQNKAPVALHRYTKVIPVYNDPQRAKENQRTEVTDAFLVFISDRAQPHLREMAQSEYAVNPVAADQANLHFKLNELEVLHIPVKIRGLQQEGTAAAAEATATTQAATAPPDETLATPRTRDAMEVYLATVEAMIGNADTGAALEALNRLENDYQMGMRNDIALLSAKYKRGENEYRKGLLAAQDYQRINNQAAFALREMLKTIPQKIEQSAQVQGFSTKNDVKVNENSGNGVVKINWLEKGLQAAKAVCRIVDTNGTPVGTGFLIAGDYLMTTSHIIKSPEEAGKLRAECSLEFGLNKMWREVVQYEFVTSDMIGMPGQELGATRIKIKDRTDKPLSTWGYLEVNQESIPAKGAALAIIHYPGGAVKTLTGADKIAAIESPYLYYTAETAGGSGGAPVFDENWKVIALHLGNKDMEIEGSMQRMKHGMLMQDIFQKINGQKTAANTPKRKTFLLSVGINQYNSELLRAEVPALKGSVSDAQKMHEWFSAHPGVELVSTVLLDAEATKANMVKAFEAHLGKAEKNDLVLFYFSGLGAVEQADPEVWREESDGQIESLACYGADTKSGTFLLADKEMRYLLRQLSEKTQADIVTIFDSCSYPGSKTREETRVKKAPSKALQKKQAAAATPEGTMKCVDTVFPRRAWDDFIFSRFFTRDDFRKRSLEEIMPPGRYLHFSACQSGEAAVETDGQGVFTTHLLEVLTQSKGQLTYSDLYSRLQARMGEQSAQHPGLFVSGDKEVMEGKMLLVARE